MESLTKSSLNNYNISFKQYNHIIEVLYNYDKKLRNKYFDNSKYSSFCKNVLNITNNTETQQHNQLNLLKVEDKGFATYRYFFINKIKEIITNTQTNLVISNIIGIVKQFNDIKLKVDCQLFENEEIPIDIYLNRINELKELKIFKIITKF